MFGFRKKKPVTPYDRETVQPVIRASICTGEQVAGFKNLETGRFEEIMVIRSDRDLQDYMERYAIEKSEIRREW